MSSAVRPGNRDISIVVTYRYMQVRIRFAAWQLCGILDPTVNVKRMSYFWPSGPRKVYTHMIFIGAEQATWIEPAQRQQDYM